jgi:hypothetical protein
MQHFDAIYVLTIFWATSIRYVIEGTVNHLTVVPILGDEHKTYPSATAAEWQLLPFIFVSVQSKLLLRGM